MLSIMVLSFNDNKLTKGCCDSIDAQGIPFEHEKVVVDNGSTKPFAKREGWRIVRLKKNRGNIGGQNACFENALGKYVLFVSNDVRFLGDSIKSLWEYDKVHSPLIGQVMPTIHNEMNYGLGWVWPGYGAKEAFIFFPSAIPSIVYIMKKEIFNLIGPFDESLGSSHEDVDMGIRLRKQRFVLDGCASSRVIHLGNQTLSKTLKNTKEVFHVARVKVIKKHYTGFDRWTRLLAVNIIDGISRAWSR